MSCAAVFEREGSKAAAYITFSGCITGLLAEHIKSNRLANFTFTLAPFSQKGILAIR